MSDNTIEEQQVGNRAEKTIMIRVRVPVDVYETIVRRADKYPGEMNVSRYAGMRLTYDIRRKHIGHQDADYREK